MRNDTKELKAMQLIADELPAGEHIDDAVKVIDDYLMSSQSVLAQRDFFQNKVKELLKENIEMKEETYFEMIGFEEQIATLKSKLDDTSYDYHSIRTALTAKLNTLNAKLAEEKKRRLTVEEQSEVYRKDVAHYRKKFNYEKDVVNGELRKALKEERGIANQAKEIADQAKKENLELRKRLAKIHEDEQETTSKLHEEILELKNKLAKTQCGSCDKKGGCDENK